MKPYFLKYQVDWINDPALSLLGEKSRRVGITYAEAYRSVRDSIRGNVKNNKTWFSSADLSASEEYIDYVSFFARGFKQSLNSAYKDLGTVIIDKDNDVTARRITFANGTEINAISSNPTAFRSKGGDIIFDEYAHHKKQDKLYAAGKPSSMRGNRFRIISTHNGEDSYFNYLISEIKKAKAEGKGAMSRWGHHKVTIDDAIKQGLVEQVLGIINRSATEKEITTYLEDAFAGMTEEAINEEFFCIPASDSSSHLLSYEMINVIERDNILDMSLEGIIGDLFMGVDVGRKKDPTCILIGEKLGEIIYTRYRQRLYNTSFDDQEAIIFSLLSHPKLRRAAFDSTGLGMQMAERAQKRFGTLKVEPIQFNVRTKEELAENTYVNVESAKVLIPRQKEMRDSLYKVRAIKTAAGNIRYEADRDEKDHADEFWSLSLMLHAAKNFSGVPRIRSAGRSIMRKTLKNYFGD